MGSTARRPRRLLAIAAACAIAATLALTTTSASAGGYVPATLTGLQGTGAQSGTLTNGVGWGVDIGAGGGVQGYVITAGQTQTYTYSEPVLVSFSISGLNCPGEGLRLPAGTQLVSAAAGHSWNAGTATITSPGGVGTADQSTFEIAAPVTSLSVTGVGAAGCFRGVFSQTISAFRNVAPTATITTPANGATYYQGQSVTADYSCDDVDNTPAQVTCAGPVADGSPIDTSTPGDQTFTVNASDTDGGTGSATTNYKVVPVQGSCSGTALGVGLLRLASANAAGDPCVTKTSNVLKVTIPLGVTLPAPLTALSGSISLSVLEGTSTKAGPTHRGTATVSEVDIKYPLNGWTFNLKNLFSSAEATMSPDGCSAAPGLTGNAEFGAMTVNGRTYNDADRPAVLPLAGLGSIRFNDVQQSTRGVATRALWVDLPGTLLDVVIGESKAAVSC